MIKRVLALGGLASVGIVISSLIGAAQSPARKPGIVDLGHPIQKNDPTWEPTSSYERSIVATIEKDGYAAGKITIDEHFGTHLDAPAHFAPKGWTVDQIPADRLYRPAVRIDVSAQVAANADYRVTTDDVKAFEQQHGAIPEGAIALVATGWDRRWPDRGRYMNEQNGVKHFPGLSAEATRYLAATRRVSGIVIDTPSIDYGPSTAFEAHHVSMALNVYHVENAARLTTLPANEFEVIVAPINIAGGSGGPTRIFALTPYKSTR
jgi:kynurenine formamidase